ncbi:MAG TPA: T9SS type A sorting domain-containing protein [Bacteroidales bacterium]|nr:T9SS type A sorting domain-containing protein [Bacteroidales bacterium]
MMKTQIFNAKMIAGLFVMCMFTLTGFGQLTGPPGGEDLNAQGLPDSIDKINKGFVDKKDCIELKLSPNPICNSATIEFELDEEATVEICLYSQQGVKVLDIVKQKFGAGTNKVTFTPSNLPSGTYYLCLCNGKQRGMRRCVII